MPMAPTNVVQYTCDKCGVTATFDRTTANMMAPEGWMVLQVWNLPHQLTFDKFECLSDYVQNPPPVGAVNAPTQTS